MRRSMLVLCVALAPVISVAALVAWSGDVSDAHAQPSRAVTSMDDADRVASALGLGPAARATLAKAQQLGRTATDCLLAHGATPAADRGLSDVAGAATEACLDELDANEAFLASSEFRAVLTSVQPQFDAASRCFERVSGIESGTVIRIEDLAPVARTRVEQANDECFRPDGLPR